MKTTLTVAMLKALNLYAALTSKRPQGFQSLVVVVGCFKSLNRRYARVTTPTSGSTLQTNHNGVLLNAASTEGGGSGLSRQSINLWLARTTYNT